MADEPATRNRIAKACVTHGLEQLLTVEQIVSCAVVDANGHLLHYRIEDLLNLAEARIRGIATSLAADPKCQGVERDTDGSILISVDAGDCFHHFVCQRFVTGQNEKENGVQVRKIRE